MQDNETPLTEFHTYAVEWSPKNVICFFDGKVVGEVLNETHIPSHHLKLKANYAFNNYIYDPCHITNNFPLEMVIDYVEVYKLKCDCSQTVTISNNNELTVQSQSVKKKITVGTSSGSITVTSPNIVLRATDEIIINNNFEVPLGKEFMAIVHDCPE